MTSAEAVRKFIADTFFIEGFAAEASFLGQQIIDSVGMMELVAFIEERYGFKLEDGELIPDNLDSLNKLTAFIERKQQSPSSRAVG